MSTLPAGRTWLGSYRSTPPGATPGPVTRMLFRLHRCTRWEFWPAWMVYGLLVPHFALLACRHRSLTVFAAANPGMSLGGFVGESKFDILQSLPREWIVPTGVVEAAHSHLDRRVAGFASLVRARDWRFPLVLKPDVGERGTDVKLVRSPAEAAAYLSRVRARVLVQPYHPGPFEVGVFYVRYPGEPRGRIFSITDKRHPRVTGNGRSSLRGLLWSDPRLRLQARTLLEQLGPDADRVPEAGESVLLTIAGNHCRGTMFLDGAALRTEALEHRIDEIARSYPGFYFGRFDLRYSSEEALARGEGFQIVELNGVLSESTNIYDPSWSLWRGLGTLASQWTHACAIGAANARRGAHVPSLGDLIQALSLHRHR